MNITVKPGQMQRDPATTAFDDLTASAPTAAPSWQDHSTLVLPFDVEPTAAEQLLIRRRLMTRDTEHEARVTAIRAAADALPESDTSGLLHLLVEELLDGIDTP